MATALNPYPHLVKSPLALPGSAMPGAPTAQQVYNQGEPQPNWILIVGIGLAIYFLFLHKKTR